MEKFSVYFLKPPLLRYLSSSCPNRNDCWRDGVHGTAPGAMPFSAGWLELFVAPGQVWCKIS